jgi:hypothetical protein
MKHYTNLSTGYSFVGKKKTQLLYAPFVLSTLLTPLIVIV